MLPVIVLAISTSINEASSYTSKSANYFQVLNTYYDEVINLVHNYLMTTLKNNNIDVYAFKVC